MAGDWIKFEKATLDKPEVFEMAEMLDVDPDAVVGKLLRVWNWFDDQSRDGNAPVTVRALLDRYSGVTGFSKSMESVGWLVVDGNTMTLPNFDRHNGQTAKTRALTAKRVSKSKSKSNAESNGASVTSALAEKRIEEKSINNTPLTPQGGDEPAIIVLRNLVNGLIPQWQKPATWTKAENRNMAKGAADQMSELSSDDWKTLSKYMRARTRQGEDYWRPHNRSKFISTFADVWCACQRWQQKQTSTSVSQPRQPEPEEPQAVDISEYATELAAFKQTHNIEDTDQAIADDPKRWADFMTYFFKSITQ